MTTFLSYDGNDRVVPWLDYLAAREKNNKSAVRFSTGMAEMDHFLDGIQTGEVMVLSGLTGNGKTLFAKTLIRNLISADIPCMALSYENNPEEFLAAFREGNLHSKPLYVPLELKPGWLPWVEERITEAKLKFDNKVVLIDHLHYVVDMNTEKMAQNIGACMRTLKTLAKNYGQFIIVVAHQEKLKDDREPGIETLRDSSFVGQEADMVIIVHRLPDDPSQTKQSDRTYEKGYAVVKIDKARRAGTFRKRLTFQKQSHWLEAL